MASPGPFLLVLQFPLSCLGDFDRLIQLENNLEKTLEGRGEIDGHDAGSGEGNIFIFTKDPEQAFRVILPSLDERGRQELRAAYRKVEDDGFTTLWPPGLKEFSII